MNLKSRDPRSVCCGTGMNDDAEVIGTGTRMYDDLRHKNMVMMMGSLHLSSR